MDDDWITGRIREEGGPWDPEKWPEPTRLHPVAPPEPPTPPVEPPGPAARSEVVPVAPMPPGLPPDPAKPHWFMGEWHAPETWPPPVSDEEGEGLLVRFLANLIGYGKPPRDPWER